jgi:hypothetical protein
VVVASFEVISQHFRGGTKETYKNIGHDSECQARNTYGPPECKRTCWAKENLLYNDKRTVNVNPLWMGLTEAAPSLFKVCQVKQKKPDAEIRTHKQKILPIFRMLLQRVRQTAYNRIYSSRSANICSYLFACTLSNSGCDIERIWR